MNARVASSGMRAVFHDFIEVLLKLAHLVGDEAERMMHREVLGISHIFVEIRALAIEFGDDNFGFDFHVMNLSRQCACAGSE